MSAYTLRTLALGTAGGYAGYSLGLPLGWLLGAMARPVVTAMAGVRVTASRRPRPMAGSPRTARHPFG